MVNKPIGAEEDEVNQRVARRIEAGRMAAGVSQVDMADALGVSVTQFQKNANGANRVSAGRLFLIAKLCKKPVSWFFERAGKETKDHDPLADFFAVPYATELAELYAEVPPPDRQTVIAVVRGFARKD